MGEREMKPGQLLKESHLPEHLQAQVIRFVDLHRDYNDKLPAYLKQPERALDFLEDFYGDFLQDRDRRADEVSSGEYEEKVVNLMHELLPMATFSVLCMDGRVKVVHTNGFTADVATAIRTPGGTLNEFNRIDGVLELDEDSPYSRKLLKASRKYQYAAQVYDSHWACAAREGEEGATGNYPKDKGLLRDIRHKREMVEATRRFLDSHNVEGHYTALIQTTFNPVTGFLYMGLETDEAIKTAEEVAKTKASSQNPDEAAKFAEYTKDVIRGLIESGKIISTGHLLEDPTIVQALKASAFTIDRVNDYVNSAAKFAEGLKALKEKLLDHIQEKVVDLYRYLNNDEPASKKELEERATLILSNLYNAYLHNSNHNEIDYLEMEDEDYEKEGHYTFDSHDEEGVKVSEGGHPPYKKAMFVVDSEDLENMPNRVEFASTIVRKNRSAGRVTDKSGYYKEEEKETFAKAPVPIVVQEITRDEENLTIPRSDWQQLEKVAWDDMPKDWDSMSNGEFRRYLSGKGIGHTLLIEGILRLRAKMARLYNLDQQSADHLKDMYKTALPIFCDVKRKTHAIIPFVKVARDDNGSGFQIAA